MMEFARNVRELIVGMKDTSTPEEENFMNIAQDLHERYLTIMDEFTVQASAQALSMRPEARIMSHQLRLRIYQDWRAKLMERIFSGSPISSSPPTKTPPPPEPIEHSAECEEATCICELEARLDAYKQVVESYLEGSIKGKRSPSSSCDSPDATDPGSDDGDEFVFEFPEFLGMAPLRERLQS